MVRIAFLSVRGFKGIGCKYADDMCLWDQNIDQSIVCVLKFKLYDQMRRILLRVSDGLDEREHTIDVIKGCVGGMMIGGERDNEIYFRTVTESCKCGNLRPKKQMCHVVKLV